MWVVVLFSFQVRLDERKQAESLFRSKSGSAMQTDMANEKSSKEQVLTFTPGMQCTHLP